MAFCPGPSMNRALVTVLGFFFVYAAAFLWQQLRDTFSAKMLNSLHLIRFTGMSGIHDRQKGMHNDISITIHAFIVCGFHMRIYRKFMDEWLSLMNRVRSSDQPVTGYNNACTLTCGESVLNLTNMVDEVNAWQSINENPLWNVFT